MHGARYTLPFRRNCKRSAKSTDEEEEGKSRKERSQLHQLVETLRESSDDQVQDLLNLIRSDASITEIQLYIEDAYDKIKQRARRPSPELDQVNAEVQRINADQQEDRGKRVMNIARLANTPPYRVPAQPWTTVTEDVDLVSHLVSVWFTWHHPWFQWLDRELFLKDMCAGKLESSFCSPFLVNMMLAEACVGWPLEQTMSRCEMMIYVRRTQTIPRLTLPWATRLTTLGNSTTQQQSH